MQPKLPHEVAGQDRLAVQRRHLEEVSGTERSQARDLVGAKLDLGDGDLEIDGQQTGVREEAEDTAPLVPPEQRAPVTAEQAQRGGVHPLEQVWIVQVRVERLAEREVPRLRELADFLDIHFSHGGF
ncbi:MAG: hypothetical protein HY271_19000 [Deltaproteobacteria bacterium]|nr:hypothetical protein [Deltaproteobacteria bacterium]